MVLNTTSHVHKQIRLLCYQLEQFTGLQMITNLENEFEEVQFKGKLSYIIVNWKEESIYVLSHKITKDEMQTLEDIVLYLSWLETGKKVENRALEPKVEKKKRTEYYNNITFLKSA